MFKINKELSTWRGMACTWRSLNILKMPVILKLIHEYIVIKIWKSWRARDEAYWLKSWVSIPSRYVRSQARQSTSISRWWGWEDGDRWVPETLLHSQAEVDNQGEGNWGHILTSTWSWSVEHTYKPTCKDISVSLQTKLFWKLDVREINTK